MVKNAILPFLIPLMMDFHLTDRLTDPTITRVHGAGASLLLRDHRPDEEGGAERACALGRCEIGARGGDLERWG